MSDILLTNLSILRNRTDVPAESAVINQAIAEIERLRADLLAANVLLAIRGNAITDQRAEIETHEAKDRGFYPIVNRSGYSDNEFSGGQGQ